MSIWEPGNSRDQSCLVKDNFSEMWRFREFTFPSFLTSVWTLSGTKVRFLPSTYYDASFSEDITPQIPQILAAESPAGQHASEQEWQVSAEGWDWGQRQRGILWKMKKKPDLTSLQLTFPWCKHARRHTGTVLHSDVCRWELRWQCALSKESLACSVNGAGSGRLAINPIRIEDSNLPLTAAVTWSDLWRPAN